MQKFGMKTFAERIHLEDRCVDGKILKWLVKKFNGIWWDGVTWIKAGKCVGVFRIKMKFLVP